MKLSGAIRRKGSYDSVDRLLGFKLEKGRTKSIHREKKALFWLIEDPDEFEAFQDTLDPAVTSWSVYHPLFARDRLIGLFAVDGMDEHVGASLKQETKERARLEAVLRSVDITIDSIFKSYYSYLEEPPKNVKIEDTFLERWNDDCLVFSPAFLPEIKRYLSPSLQSKSSKLTKYHYKPIKCELISYWDANGIKQINDRLSSHETGNEVIRVVGRWVHDSFSEIVTEMNKASFRKGDSALCHFWVVRWGGDEFIVIVASQGELGAEQREKVNEFLRDRLDQRIRNELPDFCSHLCSWKKALCHQIHEQEMRRVLEAIGVSGGWAWCEPAGQRRESFEQLYKDALIKAEEAMYIAKAVVKGPLGGRGKCAVALEFNKEMDLYRNFLKDIGGSERIPEDLRLDM
ncbi:MAG: nucleotidyl cyclase domain-containing protein [Planctomycetota bacterium]